MIRKNCNRSRRTKSEKDLTDMTQKKLCPKEENDFEMKLSGKKINFKRGRLLVIYQAKNVLQCIPFNIWPLYLYE